MLPILVGDLNYAFATSETSTDVPDVRITNPANPDAGSRPLTLSNVSMTDLSAKVKTFVDENMPGSFLMEERLVSKN